MTRNWAPVVTFEEVEVESGGDDQKTGEELGDCGHDLEAGGELAQLEEVHPRDENCKKEIG